jgi:hypothetical protein
MCVALQLSNSLVDKREQTCHDRCGARLALDMHAPSRLVNIVFSSLP